jgi:hypothetical protein
MTIIDRATNADAAVKAKHRAIWSGGDYPTPGPRPDRRSRAGAGRRPRFKTSEQALAEGWVREIAGNVVRLIQTEPRSVVGPRYAGVMGRTLGYARSTHIRKALKQLHRNGVLSSNRTGDMQSHVVTKA